MTNSSDVNVTSTFSPAPLVGLCAEAAAAAEEEHSLWYVGVTISIVSSIVSNLGVNLQKFSMQKEELLASSSREQLLASGACDSEAAAMSKIKVRPYVLQPMWVIGLAMVIAGSLGDFLALGFARQ